MAQWGTTLGRIWNGSTPEMHAPLPVQPAAKAQGYRIEYRIVWDSVEYRIQSRCVHEDGSVIQSAWGQSPSVWLFQYPTENEQKAWPTLHAAAQQLARFEAEEVAAQHKRTERDRRRAFGWQEVAVEKVRKEL